MSKYAVMPLSDYDEACDTIRELSATEENITSKILPSKITSVYDKGYENGTEQVYTEIEPINTELAQTIYGNDGVTEGTVVEALDSNVKQAKSDFEAIENKIVANGVEVAEGTPTADYAPKIDEVYEAGRKSQYGEFWDIVTKSGKRKDYSNAFANWETEYIRPTRKIIVTDSSLNSAFNNVDRLIAVEKAYFDFSQIPTLTADYMFNSCDELLIVEDCGIPALTRYARTWRLCSNLRTIEVVRSNEDTTFTMAFEGCKSLENLTIEGTIGQSGLNLQWSTKLSKASWVSIVGCYSTTISGLSMTGSLASVNSAFETSEGSNDGSTSAEWLNLIATRPNVSFNLV